MLNGNMHINNGSNGKKRKRVAIEGKTTATRRNGRLGENGVRSGSPCGGCKLLRRKCTNSCVFAPYFSSNDGAANFEVVHKFFGAGNVAKLLLNTPQNRRQEAAVTICWEAWARLSDPVHGCVTNLFAMEQRLKQQVDALRKEAEMVRTQLTNARLAIYQQQPQQQMGLPQQANLPVPANYSNSAGGSLSMSLSSNSLSMDPYGYSGITDETLPDPGGLTGLHYENESTMSTNQPFDHLERMFFSSHDTESHGSS